MGYDYLYGQAAEAQSLREILLVYRKTYRSGHLLTLVCQRTKISLVLAEEEKVKKYQDLALEIKRIHRATRVTVIPIMISLEECMAWYGKLSLPDIFWKWRVVSHPWYCSYLAESVVSLSCGYFAETWLRLPSKYQRTGEDHSIIIIIMMM